MSKLKDVLSKVKKEDVDKALSKSYEVLGAVEALNGLNGTGTRDKVQKVLNGAVKALSVLSILKGLLGK